MQMSPPKAVLYGEGGVWVPWKQHKQAIDKTRRTMYHDITLHIHAVEFEDGSIFDVVNGWRSSVTQAIYSARERDEASDAEFGFNPKPFNELPEDEQVQEMGHWAPKRNERVNHPDHYGGDTTYEVIKVLEAWGLTDNAMLFNVVKYVARAKKKDNYVEDLKKAAWYLNREIERNSPNEQAQ